MPPAMETNMFACAEPIMRTVEVRAASLASMAAFISAVKRLRRSSAMGGVSSFG